MSVTVYGASDDLIYIEGDIDEELYPREIEGGSGEADARILAFSDGTVLKILYDREGMWRIRRIASGTAEYRNVEAEDPNDRNNYSDRATLTGDIKWCVPGDAFKRRAKNSEQAAGVPR